MTLTITIPDAIATQVVDNVCTATDWTTESGITKAQWAKAEIITHIKRLNSAGAMRTARIAQAPVESQIV